MSTISTIEQKNFLATDDDVERLAREFRDAQALGRSTAGTYLKILLAAVQVALTGKPVLRAPRGPAPVLDDILKAEHREALEAQHERLYAAVLRGAVTPDIEPGDGLKPDEARRRAIERNRRTNYARTAASTLRAYIRAGGDVRRVAVPAASKGSLAARTSPAPQAPEEAVKRRVHAAAGRLTAAVEELAQVDKAMAREALQGAMEEVAGLLSKYGGTPVTRPEQAVGQHRVLRTPVGLFWPMEHRTQ
jgi:hypothetical protein